MIRHIESSHIIYDGTPADVLEFQGISDRINTPDSLTVNPEESFTYLVMLRYSDLFPNLDYAIRCKGEPTTASTGSLFFKCDNGYLRVYLHDANGTNTLEFVSNDQILNIYEHIFLAIVWDYDIKDLTVYLNGIPKQMNIVTGGSNHSLASSMGLINVVADDSYFSFATSQGYYKGNYYYELLEPRAWSSVEVSSKYAELEYTGSYDPIQEIRFFKDNSGSSPSNLYSANENGSNQAQIGTFNITSSNLYVLNKSNDASKMCFSDASVARVMNIDGSSISTNNNTNFHSSYICFSGDDTKIIGRSGAILVYCTLPLTNTAGTTITGDGSMTISGTDTVRFHVRGTTFAISIGNSGNTSNILYSGTINSAGTSWSSMSNILSLGANRSISNIKVSDDGSTIGFSAPISPSGTIAVYTIPASGGSVTQVTDGTVNCYFNCFSPDGTEIIYRELNNSKYRLMRADVDGSNAKEISYNNSNNDLTIWLD